MRKRANNPVRRQYAITITDKDGEQQQYFVESPTAYAVGCVAPMIAAKYGHSLSEAVEVNIAQLVDGAVADEKLVWHI